MEGSGRAWALRLRRRPTAWPSSPTRPCCSSCRSSRSFSPSLSGRRAVAMVARPGLRASTRSRGRAHRPRGVARRSASGRWVASRSSLPVGLLILSFGISNLQRCWAYTMDVARSLDQLGRRRQGLRGRPGLLALLLVAAVSDRGGAADLHRLSRAGRTMGRALLAALPVALWLAARARCSTPRVSSSSTRSLAPYLFLFVPRAQAGGRRQAAPLGLGAGDDRRGDDGLHQCRRRT